MTLRSKTLLPLAALSALLFVFLYVSWFPSSTLVLERQELSATRRHLASVAEGLVPLLLAHELDTVYENLDALLKQNGQWVSILLVDAGGRLIYPLRAAAPAGAPVKGARVLEHRLRHLDHDLGTLTLTVDLSSILAAAERRHRQLAMVLLVVLCGYLVGIAVVVELVIRRPVHLLASAAERVARGDFGAPLVGAGGDEVGVLVGSFARMRDAIRDQHRELRAIGDCHQALLRAVDEPSLLETICRIVCDEAGYRMAWVGFAEDDEARTLRPVAWAGAESGYLEQARLTWADTERGRGPSGTAIRTGESSGIEDFAETPQAAPWRESALERGYRSSLALPLEDEGGRTFGVLNIYSSRPGAFTAEETALLGSLAGDLAFGIVVLRGRAERQRAAEEIRTLNRELERRVADRTAQLEAANRELEAFAYSVSHDLRAPLRHLDGFLGLLQERSGAGLDAEARHYVAAISDAARRMGALIDDLLSFSRMGRSEMTRGQVDLGALIREVIQELEPEARGRIVRWHVAPLPTVVGDRAMLRLALANLVSNALKFTRPRAEAEIEVGRGPDQGAEAVFFVRDNGVGFDMRYVGKLFGVFQRLHRAEDFEGTGIGLANVRRVIERHGGRSWAEGNLGEGATFSFSLPRGAPT